MTPSRVASGGVFYGTDPELNRDDTFVVTLRMDEVSFERLDLLRKRHFPPIINCPPAHLTLFHALSDDQVAKLRVAGPGLIGHSIRLQFARPILIGHGVAIEVDRGAAADLHRTMVDTLGYGLTRQDQRPFRPHVTIQNKVTREVAKATLLQVMDDFSPWHGAGIGLDVWRYLGGAWAPHSYLACQAPSHAPSR